MAAEAGTPGVIGQATDAPDDAGGDNRRGGGPDTTGIVVATDRLVVRAFRPDDLPDLVELHADPDVMHYITNGEPADPEAVADALDGWIEAARRDLDSGCWVAIERRSTRFIGWFHLFRDPPPATASLELGYRLRRDVWGRGLATEGARALIDRTFLTTDATRVRAETMAVHHASRRVMDKCGMRLVRAFRADWPVRIAGDEHGDVEYAIDRAHWVTTRRSDANNVTPTRPTPPGGPA